LSSSLLAQDMEPKPIQNNDLRGGKELFSWSYDKGSLLLSLEGEKEYHLIREVKEGKVNKKISSQEAEQIDQEFVAVFIENKYSGNYSVDKNCKKLSKMTMRGEVFEFCIEKSRPVALDSFWEKLNNNFKK